ncbi:Putative ribonuclease H protein At1g65750 [Linum perenne]
MSSPVNPPRRNPPENHNSRPPDNATPDRPLPTPQPLKSYSSTLSGVLPDQPSSPAWICVGENDITPVISNGVRALRLSQGFKEKLCKPWTNTVVIRLIGKSVGYSYLCNRLRSMWKPSSSMQVIDVDLNCFMVRFGEEKDYFRALTGGPWLILDHYLVVQQWDPSFRVSDKLPSKMVVWIRFPHLPIQLYHKQILSSLGNLIGRTVRMEELGFAETNDLGRYLGVPVLHGRINKGTHKYLIERIDKKLEGWKRNTLSLAGRVTLASSVLNSIPAYAMQTTLLPASITKDIDARIRNFVWGSTSDKRKTHLISWDVVCRPKSEGGLGLKKAKELNEAFMMKLGWLILKAPEKLWVNILASKYLKNSDQGMQLRRKTGGSNLWRGIRKTWTTMAAACQHSIRDGTSTLFWHHRWLDSGDRLADHALQPIDSVENDRTVADAVTALGDWDWNHLHAHLSPCHLEQIAGMGPPQAGSGDDDMIWGPDPRGKFTVSSAYEILAADQSESDQNLWKQIWKWQGPNRVRHFLWLVGHNRLLTNEERRKRHMTNEGGCRLCPSIAKDSLHVLRDCKAAKTFWKEFLPQAADASFFSGNLRNWLLNTICDTELSLPCGIAMWLLWKARNEDTFEGKSVTSAQLRLRVHSWIAGVRETMKSSSQILSEVVGRRRDTLVRWIPAPDEWITINTDGSVIQPLSYAAGGGVIRNSHGAKLAAFAANFGKCSIMRAELRAAAKEHDEHRWSSQPDLPTGSGALPPPVDCGSHPHLS